MSVEREQCYVDILQYSDNLFNGALYRLSNGDPKIAEIYAVCAYSAAAFVRGMSEDKELKKRAANIHAQAQAISKEAKSRMFGDSTAPSMNGVEVEYVRDDAMWEEVSAEIQAMVSEIAAKRKRRR